MRSRSHHCVRQVLRAPRMRPCLIPARLEAAPSQRHGAAASREATSVSVGIWASARVTHRLPDGGRYMGRLLQEGPSEDACCCQREQQAGYCATGVH